MRFIENGPSIPDDLLNARDQGSVVFVCGAGVSRARAGVPDFFGLAESVIRELGVSSDSDACKVLEKAREIGEEIGVTGLISADRVFSLLERDFTSSDIQREVTKSLASPANVDRSAHQMLLRLAKTPGGKTQLVTTNFDRLFEDLAAPMRVHQPPRLPHLSRYDDLDGIIYLHGRVNDDYSGAEGDGFVLSSSEFGHAYLSEAWATEFFREVVRGYVVVFVGYSADDPPVSYLLEGLRRQTDAQHHIYAFQSDAASELTLRWEHKGVNPIGYSPADGHRALWDTLEQWAIRADDPKDWEQSVLKRAVAGPRQHQPHERGQVAHIVSNHEGARAFAEVKPPAEWLCVFDPACRYERPGQLDWMESESPTVDAFQLYGLDSDFVPQRSDSEAYPRTQRAPTDAWDAFTMNSSDREGLSRENFAAARGASSSSTPRLPNRLACLGGWIANVVNQPAAAWWAARQESLHPGYRQSIAWAMTRADIEVSRELRRVWQYLLEAWAPHPVDSRFDWYELREEINRDGWSLAAVRRYVNLTRPRLAVSQSIRHRPVPPTMEDAFEVADIVRFKVVAPAPPDAAEIPDAWLCHVVRGLRANIEASVRLIEEVNDHYRARVSPIEVDDSPGIDTHGRTEGLSGCVITLASLFDRLLEYDSPAAHEEFLSWPSDDDIAFARLRLWASGKPEVSTPDTFSRLILELSDDVFWGGYHQRDLLLVLSRRWGELADSDRRRIEARLLDGPRQFEHEEENSYRKRCAWAVLDRLQWLKNRLCSFSFDFVEEVTKRGPDAPEWTPESANVAADSREIRTGFVSVDTEFSQLESGPIGSVLAKALELSGRSETDRLREFDPFAGLCTERPLRAYRALSFAARNHEYPDFAWKTFLGSDAREKDAARLSAVIAERLWRLPEEALRTMLYPATWWFQRVAKTLSKEYPEAFDRIGDRFIEVATAAPVDAPSVVVGSQRGRDWFTEAINSSVGHVVTALLDDTRIDTSKPASIGPCLEKIQRLLSLGGDPRRLAIAILAERLAGLNRINAAWTEEHLLSILDVEDGGDREAFWAGYFWNPQISSPDLYLRIKEALLNVAKQEEVSRKGHARSLAYLVLQGWVTRGDDGHKWVSDSELRDVLLHGGDELRSHVLWQFERLLSRNDDERQKWQSTASAFFENVWPRQRSVKSSRMTARLFEVLLTNHDSFAALLEVVLPLLTRIDDGTALHVHFRSEVDEIAKTHPDKLLRRFYAVLPNEVQRWPYGVSDAIEKIAAADGRLIADERLIELRRRWNAR